MNHYDHLCRIPPDLVRGPISDALPLAGEVNWGMELLGIQALRSITEGEGIKIGGVDTGVDDSHPLLQGVKAKDFTGSRLGFRDGNGHGTHIMGTIGASDPRLGVAPKAALYHGKGLGDSGSGSMTDLLNAIEWCLSEGCTIVSNSWGGGTTVDPGTDRRLREWAERGVWLIFAAGNSGPNTQQTDAPGNSPHVLNVAAIARNFAPASFTSAGAKIDTAGPGVDIISCRPGGGFQSMSGTSMATPWVSGTLALYQSSLGTRKLPIPNVYELRAMLRNDSVDTHTPGVDRRTGPGWISPLMLSLNLVPDPPKVV